MPLSEPYTCRMWDSSHACTIREYLTVPPFDIGISQWQKCVCASSAYSQKLLPWRIRPSVWGWFAQIPPCARPSLHISLCFEIYISPSWLPQFLVPFELPGILDALMLLRERCMTLSSYAIPMGRLSPCPFVLRNMGLISSPLPGSCFFPRVWREVPVIQCPSSTWCQLSQLKRTRLWWECWKGHAHGTRHPSTNKSLPSC